MDGSFYDGKRSDQKPSVRNSDAFILMGFVLVEVLLATMLILWCVHQTSVNGFADFWTSTPIT